MRVSQIAKRLSLSKSHVYKLLDSAVIPKIKLSAFAVGAYANDVESYLKNLNPNVVSPATQIWSGANEEASISGILTSVTADRIEFITNDGTHYFHNHDANLIYLGVVDFDALRVGDFVSLAVLLDDAEASIEVFIRTKKKRGASNA
jgi:predicted DNA-binding transcriptional regulator AlpA